MRYAPGEIDTEKKKMYFFKKGLNSHLKVALSDHTYHTLREMINKVLEMERDRLEVDALYKKKKVSGRDLFSYPGIPEATCTCASLVSSSLYPGSYTCFEPWRWYLLYQLSLPCSKPPNSEA
jgi:hypothetical protein